MKKLSVLLLFLLLFFGCGVKNSDKEYMQAVLTNELAVQYVQANILPLLLELEITELKKESEPIYGGTYRGRFQCTFQDNNDKIFLLGDVAFDAKMQVQRVAEKYGTDKIGISVWHLHINGVPLEPSQRNASPYVLASFMNTHSLTASR